MSCDGDLDALGRGFIEAANRRDADALIAVSDAAIELHPTILVGGRRTYRGHDGLRRWLADLRAARVQHRVRIREVRQLDEHEAVFLNELVVSGDVMAESAMFARAGEGGKLVEIRAYISDVQTLAKLGRIEAEP